MLLTEKDFHWFSVKQEILSLLSYGENETAEEKFSSVIGTDEDLKEILSGEQAMIYEYCCGCGNTRCCCASCCGYKTLNGYKDPIQSYGRNRWKQATEFLASQSGVIIEEKVYHNPHNSECDCEFQY